MRRAFPILATAMVVLVSLAVPHASALERWAPTAVEAAGAFVQNAASAGAVTWQPGTQLADKYNVYGLSGGSFVFLTAAIGFSAPVPGGYSGYAVSGVLNGVESNKVMAVGPCVAIETDPPDVVLCPTPSGAVSPRNELYVGMPPVEL